MNNQTTNLLGLTRRNMETFFVDIGERSFRASQVMKWIYHADVDDFSAMTNLSKVFRGRLTEIMEIRAPEIMGKQVSRDGTTKWLMRLDGGDCVETVFIPEENRGTLCVSSQVGCALDCTFCATARQGFNRNLTVAEIVGQVYLARKELSGEGGKHGVITNVVLMGMGEPLLNFEPVAQAMELIMDDLAMGLARKRVTLSTAGVVPAIDRLRERCPVSLAVSLHAPTDELRNRLVPLNRKYPLGSLIDACKRYSVSGPKPQVTFEYIMLGGINDGIGDARQLVRLLQGVPAKVNLIPFNPFPGASFTCSAPAAIDSFREVLVRSGFVTITRKTRGEDIKAACGQLVGDVTDRTHRVRRDGGVETSILKVKNVLTNQPAARLC